MASRKSRSPHNSGVEYRRQTVLGETDKRRANVAVSRVERKAKYSARKNQSQVRIFSAAIFY